MKKPKALKNPELIGKFPVGTLVAIPPRVVDEHAPKNAVMVRPVLGRVLGYDTQLIGKQLRHVLRIGWRVGVLELHDERQIASIHETTKDQLDRFRGKLPSYLTDPSEKRAPKPAAPVEAQPAVTKPSPNETTLCLSTAT